MQTRNIVTNLLLTIITCGLYGLYWMVTITDDTAYQTEDHSITGGTALLLTIVTCGIYGIYWNYKMARNIYQEMQERGIYASDNAVVCLILSIFRLDIVSYCILQGDLNRLIESDK